jgi:hypothetical protein
MSLLTRRGTTVNPIPIFLNLVVIVTLVPTTFCSKIGISSPALNSALWPFRTAMRGALRTSAFVNDLRAWMKMSNCSESEMVPSSRRSGELALLADPGMAGIPG